MSKVILTDQTTTLLKNFSLINPSILVRAGNVLKTISVGENIVAEYNCEEEFPVTFGIYDLVEFCQGLGLFQNPSLSFDNDSYVTITSGSGMTSARYYFSNPEITLKSAPEKNIQFPSTDMEFVLDGQVLQTILDAARTYSLPDISFKSEDKNITVNLLDREDDTCNTFNQTVQGESTDDFEVFMKVDNIRVYQVRGRNDDYRIRVSKSLITEWSHRHIDLKYYIALEP